MVLFSFFFFLSLSPTRFFKFKRTLFDTVPYTSLAEICCTILKIDFSTSFEKEERGKLKSEFSELNEFPS